MKCSECKHGRISNGKVRCGWRGKRYSDMPPCEEDEYSFIMDEFDAYVFNMMINDETYAMEQMSKVWEVIH